jgi:hypothetical protein
MTFKVDMLEMYEENDSEVWPNMVVFMIIIIGVVSPMQMAGIDIIQTMHPP